ncbi:hypothetical protein MY5147_007691 [Beauveria neobassiana]
MAASAGLNDADKAAFSSVVYDACPQTRSGFENGIEACSVTKRTAGASMSVLKAPSFMQTFANGNITVPVRLRSPKEN